MEQLLNWIELNRWIVQQEWVVTAACDMVAFLCLAGIAGVVARRRPAPRPEASKLELAAVTPVAEAKRPAEAKLPAEADDAVPEARPRRTPPTTAVGRKDVRRALEAIGRWEHDYGKPRGLQELANMVEAKRNSQARIQAAS